MNARLQIENKRVELRVPQSDMWPAPGKIADSVSCDPASLPQAYGCLSRRERICCEALTWPRMYVCGWVYVWTK